MKTKSDNCLKDNEDKKELKCSNSKVIDDTFICKSVIWQNNQFIVACGKYGKRNMIAMRWIENPEPDVKNCKILKGLGFPFNIKMEPVWITVPFELVEPLKAFFEEQNRT